MPPDDIPTPPEPILRAVEYLTGTDPALAVGIEPRPTGHTGTHVRVLRTGGTGRRDWPLVGSRLTFDISHEDALEAGTEAERILSILDAWPWAEPDVYRDPRSDGATPVWNPLDDPRVPAYTLTITIALAV